MKRTFLDKLVGFISPSAESRRIQARIRTEMNLRAYDISKSFPTSDWVSAYSASSNKDTKNAIEPGRNKARSLAQNNPYALKAENVIVNETVGTGIVPNITGRNKSQTKKLEELWKQWGETTLCDYEGQQNFYGLQALALRSTVNAGEGLALKRTLPDGSIKIKLIEPDFIVTNKDEQNIYQGIELDGEGNKLKYHLYVAHPGDRNASDKTFTLPPSSILHVYKKERAGQLRAVTWAHAIVEKIHDFEEMQGATLIGRKLQACFAGVITTNGSDAVMSAADLKAKRQAEMDMQPGTWKYLNQGEDVKSLNPPSVDGYAEFNRETLRAIANGYGISYEALTGDYSQSNYSSSRMGHLQMRKNIEAWRWNMFIPQFCDPAFKWFLEWASRNGAGDTSKVRVDWVAPAFQMIDPSKEVASLQREVRSGFKSYKYACKELGLDPEQTLLEIQEFNQKFDDMKLVLDIDPRRLSQQGQAQSADPLAPKSENQNPGEEEGITEDAESNKEDASEESASSES
jgi:lambda family phage portal protein